MELWKPGMRLDIGRCLHDAAVEQADTCSHHTASLIRQQAVPSVDQPVADGLRSDSFELLECQHSVTQRAATKCCARVREDVLVFVAAIPPLTGRAHSCEERSDELAFRPRVPSFRHREFAPDRLMDSFEPERRQNDRIGREPKMTEQRAATEHKSTQARRETRHNTDTRHTFTHRHVAPLLKLKERRDATRRVLDALH